MDIENPPIEKKKRRKRHSGVTLIVNGKRYRGMECLRHGDKWTLITKSGHIQVDTTHGTVVELVGKFTTATQYAQTATQVPPPSVAVFSQRRNAAIDAMLKMPGGLEVES